MKELVSTDEHERRFIISFKRAKSIGPPVVTECNVINVLECQCIQNYMSCLRRGAESTKVSQINVEKSCGHRLWRKLSADLIPCQPVGKNTGRGCASNRYKFTLT